MNYLKINGEVFDNDVAIKEYEMNFNVLDGENTGRVLSGDMERDIIGTYIGHKVTVFNGKGQAGFDRLVDYLIAHSIDKDGVLLEAAYGQKSMSYQAYYTVGTVKLPFSDGSMNYWDALEINFIPMSPQVRP